MFTINSLLIGSLLLVQTCAMRWGVKENDVACISLETSEIELTVRYQAKDGHMRTTKFVVPDSAIPSGHCDGVPSMTLNFHGNWSVSFNFTLGSWKVFMDDYKNFIYQVDLNPSPLPTLFPGQHAFKKDTAFYQIGLFDMTVYPDETTFPDNTLVKGEPFTTKEFSRTFPRVPNNKDFYKCEESLTYKFDQVDLTFKGLTFKAFGKDREITFDGKPEMCESAAPSGLKKL